jgi:predicted exporter
MPNKNRFITIVTWLLLALLAVAQLLFNTSYQSDMTAFMPTQKGSTFGSVSQTLKEGPAARLWLLAIEGASVDELARISQQYAAQLRDSDQFVQVMNGEMALSGEMQAQILSYRYLLDGRIDANYFSAASLNSFMMQRLDELRSPLSGFTKQWLAADPTAAMLHLLQQKSPPPQTLVLFNGVWFSEDQRQALLMVETKAPGFDLEAQQQVQEQIHKLFAVSATSSSAKLLFSGAPPIALQTRDAIKRESQMLSLYATLFTFALLILVYHSLPRVLLMALPIGAGMLMATAAVALIFGEVHLITLAFGVTIIGVAVDYPIHLLSHARRGEPLAVAMARIWPTLRLGVLSTLLGYLAMALTSFTGLAQLGVFSVAGILTAALITKTLLPCLMVASDGPAPRLQRLSQQLNVRPLPLWSGALLLLALLLAVVIGHERISWSDDIAQFSPIPKELLAQDRELRATLGGADNRYLITVEESSPERLLQRQEMLLPLLQEAVIAGEITGYTLAAQLLPSQQLQRQRQALLPDEAQLRHNLMLALSGTPFPAQLFEPFIQAVAKAREMEPLTFDRLAQTPFNTQLAALLSQSDTKTMGLVRLSGVADVAALQQRLQQAALADVQFIDLKQASSQVVTQFRAEAQERIIWASVVLLLALWLGLGSWRRIVRVIVPVAVAVMIAIAVPVLLGEALNLFHLVALLLVAGIGLDYSLFFSTPAQSEDNHATLHSLMICCISTVGVFAILATAAIPVLHAIGVTVSSGVLAAFVLSWGFSRNTTLT